MDPAGISAEDRALIQQLRQEIQAELLLVPAYDDQYSLLRWLVGWDRKLGSFYWSASIVLFVVTQVCSSGIF
ncbi:unnamed protein product [Gongylonema pulchrum]|uniref:Transmembrane protein n=1 Tax=Gongylonema pulchrum TaxID=637853 RepID=A0A183ES67_9BILA|nr:unnamed protein product [Gongylonema pulchrum]